VGYLLYTGLTQDATYFLNVSEALAMEHAELDQARLFGKVAASDLERDPSSLGAEFTLQDNKDPSQTIRVDFHGVVPDTFKPGVEVIVEGGMMDRVFQAKSLITKCPSKYKKQQEG
jgi:cytochrome c-type biogenesis protein CcmE